MSFEGSLRDTPMPSVLDTIGAERQTGILTVQDEKEIVAVTFLRGEIVGVDSLVEQEEALGVLMEEEGLVEPEDFASVLAAHRTGGGHVPELLVARGLVDRTALLGALRRHAARRARRLLEWRAGTYRFYAGDEVAYEDGFEPIDIDEILGLHGQVGPRGELTAFGEAGGEVLSTSEPNMAELRDPRVIEIERALAEARPGSLSEASTAAHRLAAARIAADAKHAAHATPTAAPAAAPSPKSGSFPTLPPAQVAAATAKGPARRVEASRILRRISSTGTKADLLPTAVALALAVLALLVLPGTFVLPLPWNRAVRDALDESRRDAVFRRVDGAARAFHLVEGSYPATLTVLGDEGLLDPGDLRGPHGERVEYSPSGASYALQLTHDGALSGPRAVETTAGDFLLDPSFQAEAEADSRPLVLLD